MAMPIRAENRHRYPRDWPDISRAIRERAGWRCENCGAANGEPHPITGSRVVLTVGHLDHTPEHCQPENLRAWCQRCHLRYDAEHHAKNAAETRRNRMQTLDLFDA
jgi:5-methylcytosine-specific restriction endonuclease McrA